MKICCHASRSVARSIDRSGHNMHARMNTMLTTPWPDHRKSQSGTVSPVLSPARTLASCQSSLGASQGASRRLHDYTRGGEGSLGNSRRGVNGGGRGRRNGADGARARINPGKIPRREASNRSLPPVALPTPLPA